MFEVCPGQRNTDTHDFITRRVNNSVDIKSASKPYHSRIMIPIDQFENMPKDFYVGVQINTKLDEYDNILLETITSADIYGYYTYKQLSNMETKNFEHPCKAMYLNSLSNINHLLDKF